MSAKEPLTEDCDPIARVEEEGFVSWAFRLRLMQSKQATWLALASIGPCALKRRRWSPLASLWRLQNSVPIRIIIIKEESAYLNPFI